MRLSLYFFFFFFQVGLLNVDGYYNSLLSFIDTAVEEGFVSPNARHIIISAPTARELVKKLEVTQNIVWFFLFVCLWVLLKYSTSSHVKLFTLFKVSLNTSHWKVKFLTLLWHWFLAYGDRIMSHVMKELLQSWIGRWHSLDTHKNLISLGESGLQHSSKMPVGISEVEEANL